MLHVIYMWPPQLNPRVSLGNFWVYVLGCKLVFGQLGLRTSFLFELEHCDLLCYCCDFVGLCLLYELPWQANPTISFGNC